MLILFPDGKSLVECSRLYVEGIDGVNPRFKTITHYAVLAAPYDGVGSKDHEIVSRSCDTEEEACDLLMQYMRSPQPDFFYLDDIRDKASAERLKAAEDMAYKRDTADAAA